MTGRANRAGRRLAMSWERLINAGHPPGSPELGLGPAAVQVRPDQLRLGQGFAASVTVCGYPHQVGAGWLGPLLTHPGPLEVALHVEPVPALLAADRLRKQLARLESTRRIEEAKGRLPDPGVEASAEDARDLADRLARTQTRLFRAGLYATVHAASSEQVTEQAAGWRSTAAASLLDTHPVTWRALAGWVTCLPLGLDRLGMRRVFDTQSLAAAFPFNDPDLPAQPDGVLLGVNPSSAGLVVWDRWGADNYNQAILARSGAGKSYLAKLELMRQLFDGVQAAVIDPEGEYATLAAAVDGTRLRLGEPGVRVNPFDLPSPDPSPGQNFASRVDNPAADDTDASWGSDGLTRRALFCHTLVSVLVGGELSAAERAVLDAAILAAYTSAGITFDPRTWTRPVPVLADLVSQLEASGHTAGSGLAARLAPYTRGSWRTLFDGPSSHAPGGHLVVWDLRDLAEELKPVGLLLALDATWRQVTSPVRRRRLVVVDEAWQLMQHPAGAAWLYRMAKSARRHWAGLTVITQDVEDLLGSELGRAVLANSATQILLRQAPQVLPAVREAFGLTAGEASLLAAARRGEGLLSGGPQHRVALRALASPEEHRLVTTDPAELADQTAQTAQTVQAGLQDGEAP
jgi:hypothetical protein